MAWTPGIWRASVRTHNRADDDQLVGTAMTGIEWALFWRTSADNPHVPVAPRADEIPAVRANEREILPGFVAIDIQPVLINTDEPEERSRPYQRAHDHPLVRTEVERPARRGRFIEWEE